MAENKKPTKRSIELDRLTTERTEIQKFIVDDFPKAKRITSTSPVIKNPCPPQEIGTYRNDQSLVLASSDHKVLRRFGKTKPISSLPSFYKAGPREDLKVDPVRSDVLIATTGGLAPGINSVIHSIVDRHLNTYARKKSPLRDSEKGFIRGIINGFKGLHKKDLSKSHNYLDLTKTDTKEWIRKGGSELGNVRYKPFEESDDPIFELAKGISSNLSHHVNILYLVGGDGTLRVAHELAKLRPDISIVGVPKTMDNDILWSSPSFGFDSAVAQATRAIDHLKTEAKSTRRVGIIEFFGAESGFVTANAALASRGVDMILVPEEFTNLEVPEIIEYWNALIQNVTSKISRRMDHEEGYALIVVAEGVKQVLSKKEGLKLGGESVTSKNFIDLLQSEIKKNVDISFFTNKPQHYIRSVPANSHDQIHCERLGAVAVDAALTGFTDCMVSRWTDHYVIVPLELVVSGQKSIAPNSLFWKQVINDIQQPSSQKFIA